MKRMVLIVATPFSMAVIPDMPGVSRGMIGNPEEKKIFLDSRFRGNDRR